MDTNDKPAAPSLLENAMTSAIYAPKALEQQFLVVARAVLGIFTLPAELAIRPAFGTQTISPITFLLGAILMQLVGLASFFIPGTGVDGWTIYLAFLLLAVLHGIRLRRKYLDMDLEEDGECEGPTWAVFRKLPGSDTVIRCIYEPLAFMVIPWALNMAGLLTSFAAIYLMVVGLCLMVRTMLRYYELWSYVRDMRNARHRARMLRLMVEGQLTVEQMQVLVMTGFPVNTPPAVREEATAAVLDPKFAALKTPKIAPPSPDAASA